MTRQIIITPGIGSNLIHIGHTEKQVRLILGKPSYRAIFPRRSYFYIYRKQGIDIDFRKRGGIVNVIFFYAASKKRRTGASIITDKGIQLGDLYTKVLDIYGEPDKRGGAYTYRSGRKLGGWLYYSNGIQFDFDDFGKICTISISKSESTTNLAENQS